jgi:type VII secretion integral membrane protein EccD
VTSIESRSYCRVVVIAPATRVDLALPADVALIDLLPMLLQYAGETGEDGGSGHGGWKLVRVGHGELDGGRTLRSLDVTDGEVLRLVPREERSVAPVFDDIVDAIATTRRDRINARSVNPGLGAAVIVTTMAVVAVTLYVRGVTRFKVSTADAYISGGIALALLGLATAIAQGYRNRIVATATAASAIPLTVVCGVNAVPGAPGHWGVLVGSSIALVYSLVAMLALGTGTVVFAATATTSLFVAISALIAGLGHLEAIRVVAGCVAVALAALAVLPRLAVRLARLPLTIVPTTSEDLQESDEVGDVDDVTARARLAGEYLTGTQIGCAATIGFCAMVLGVHLGVLAVALAATAVVAMALRARSVASLGARIALIGSGVLGGLVAAVVIINGGREGDGLALLGVELGLAALALIVTTAHDRRRASPPTMRLVDFFEAGVVIAVLPLAVGVMGLYDLLRHL